MKFARILSDDRNQLIFSATLSYGGSGLPSTLAVVDFDQGQAHIVYTWNGEGLNRDWKLREEQIVARSSYWTRGDSHCCPSRSYTFTVGDRKGYITELEDQRPYLGVLVRETGAGAVAGPPLRVIDIADNSPAASALRVGDVLLDVTNAPPVESPVDAGETAKLLVRRDGADVTVPVRLGSLRDAGGLIIPVDDYSVDAM